MNAAQAVGQAFPHAVPGIAPELLERLVRTAAPDRLALVGGAVRDLLLHRVHDHPWRGVHDLDLVVEAAGGADTGIVPPAHRLARRLMADLGCAGVPYCQEHATYGTVELELRATDEPILLDLASARCESYPQPAENPVVRLGSLGDDLGRRDFTINAMALRFEATGAVLVDPHGGRADLKARRLSFLHERSVEDDPTRVLRAARYAARLGFELSEPGLQQLASTLGLWPWAWKQGDPPGTAPPALGTRLRMELELLLEREPWQLALGALQRWGALPLIDGQLQGDRHWRLRLTWATRLGVARLPALLTAAADPLAVAERLQIPHSQHKLLAQFLTLRRRLEEQAKQTETAAGWCALLEAPGVSAEAVALAIAAGAQPRRCLLRWWLRWRHLRSARNASELMRDEGFRPGPALGARLVQLREERLAGERC